MPASAGSLRSRIRIVFPDDWAPFSPTLTRLVDHLAGRFEVEVLAFDSGRFDLGVLDPLRYIRVGLSRRLASALRRAGLLRVIRTLLLAWHLRRAAAADHTIAVDADGAMACWLAGLRMHYLSLEVGRPSPVRWIVPRRARSIIIQSEERLDYQFDPASIRHLPVFLIQNAPPISGFPPAVDLPRDLAHPRLVYMGNLIASHGLYRMLDLLRAWPEASLTLQGIVPANVADALRGDYADLSESGRLRVLDRYLAEEEIGPFLQQFDVGLCLYEPADPASLDFNYASSPAGKMFNYFAAGLPVLASRLPGLRPVADYDAGLQAPTNEPSDLMTAGRAICASHGKYRQGALRAARAFDFTAAAARFAAHLSASDVGP